MSDVLFEKRGHVALVTLNRPDTLNALTATMADELLDGLDELVEDSEVRAVVLTGAGRGFCSGFDLKAGNIADARRKSVFRMMEFEKHWLARLRTYAKPTICAVNGVAAGGGLGLALACDMRIASSEARFSAIFSKIGMTAQDAAAALLPQIVGIPKALEMIYTAKMVGPEEAERIGLANEVVPADQLIDHCIALGNRIAELSPIATAISKQVVIRGYNRPMEDQLAFQNLGSFLNMNYAQEDLKEAVTAFVEKRKPVFKGG